VTHPSTVLQAIVRRALPVLAALAVAVPRGLAAQDVTAMSVTGDHAPASTKAALTAGLIVVAAGGAQFLKSPEAWPLTWQGFGARVADQTGFYLVQTATFQSLRAALDYRADAVLCPRATLVRCSVVATFTAFDRRGQRRPNVPLLTSIVVATGASIAWRPERQDNGEAWAIFGKRVGIAVGGYVAERIVLDWWAQRRR
jgi:hypothetical protein